MRVTAPAGSPLLGLVAAICLAPFASGCASTTNSPSVLQAQITTLNAQQASLANKNQELQSRANTLDQDNQELETVLAQAKQQKQLADEQLVAVRAQLSSVSTQLAQVKGDRDSLEQKAQAVASTARKRISASITANSSLRQNLPTINIAGIESRVDGDVVRIELPADRVFEPNTAQIQPTATTMLDSVVGEILRTYPDQIIGIEGHTDNESVVNGQMVNNHQLALARAGSVFDYLTQRSRLPAQQLFVVGHGPNHPVVSNATPAGRARNRRIELVVYPEKVGQ